MNREDLEGEGGGAGTGKGRCNQEERKQRQEAQTTSVPLSGSSLGHLNSRPPPPLQKHQGLQGYLYSQVHLLSPRPLVSDICMALNRSVW